MQTRIDDPGLSLRAGLTSIPSQRFLDMIGRLSPKISEKIARALLL